MWRQILSATLFLAGALGNGLSDYGSPEVNLDYGRVFRPNQDLKILETRYATGNHHQYHHPIHQLPARKKQSTASRPGQIVYGKPIFIDAVQTRQQAVRPVAATQTTSTNKKFKPSPEDPFLTSANQHYSPSQKYLQKYANQLYTAQKNSAYLSEYQKYILNQDPAVKKFVFQQQQRGPKQLDLYAGGASTATTVVTKKKKKVTPTTTTTTTPVPATTISVVTTGRNRQSKKKVEDLEDNAAQSSLYRFAYKPETVAEYIPVYTSSDKEALALYNQAAAQLSTAQLGHYTPTVQYATTPGYSFNAYHVASTGTGKDEHHDDSSEPKYEFKYDVNDNEKNSKFGHAEARKGKTTWGKYYVQLADGRFETVKYWADKTGYHAEVDFKGQAKHPSSTRKEVGLLQDYAHLGAGADLKQYGVDPSQFYSVSETSPVEYH